MVGAVGVTLGIEKVDKRNVIGVTGRGGELAEGFGLELGIGIGGRVRARPQCPVVDDPGVGGDVGQTLHERRAAYRGDEVVGLVFPDFAEAREFIDKFEIHVPIMDRLCSSVQFPALFAGLWDCACQTPRL